MILWLTTVHENDLSPLGERVDRDGAFTSRRGPGEGVLVRYSHGSEESALVRLRPELQILRFAQDDSHYRLHGRSAGP